MILEDAVEVLKGKAFWKHSKEGGERLKDRLKSSAESSESRNKDKVNIICAAKSKVIETLKDLVETFVCKAVKNSEICKYWEAILKNIRFLNDLIAADRTGNWDAHLQAVQNLLPLFRESDSINYLKYASLYLEQMRRLPVDHPEIHVMFMSRHFVVPQINGSFNAVSPDMKLEQSIQRSQKSVHGIIGQTRKSKYVTEWEVAYHETLSIVFRTLTCSNIGSRESYLHHELV